MSDDPIVDEEDAVGPPAAGFVRMVHAGHGGIGDVPDSSVPRHRALGWIPVDELEAHEAELDEDAEQLGERNEIVALDDPIDPPA